MGKRLVKTGVAEARKTDPLVRIEDRRIEFFNFICIRTRTDGVQGGAGRYKKTKKGACSCPIISILPSLDRIFVWI